MNKDLPFYVALSQAPGIGLKRFNILVKHFGSAQAVWRAPEKILDEILEPSVFQKFSKYRISVEPQKLISTISNKKINVLTLLDKEYPENLRQIFDPPNVLYFKGELKREDHNALAVVGTRKITSYGKEVTEMLVRDLSVYNLTIVSGLARGVDSFAHKLALENGLRTIAVLGSGVDVIYPPENQNLAAEITKNGALISEIPPGIQPTRGYFPARNRIISGLSLGVLITEADEKSGSLITAGQALEQNREVFAVPGPIYSKLSRGPTELIKQGAKVVAKAEDIIEELNIGKTKIGNKKQSEIKGENKEERLIIRLLQNEVKHFDQISRESNLTPEKLNSLMVTMELSGKVKNLGGGNYSLTN